jgi:hypothetical protein
VDRLSAGGGRPDYFGFLAAAFIVGCMITGLYTMVIYAIITVTNLQKVFCS